MYINLTFACVQSCIIYYVGTQSTYPTNIYYILKNWKYWLCLHYAYNSYPVCMLTVQFLHFFFLYLLKTSVYSILENLFIAFT